MVAVAGGARAQEAPPDEPLAYAVFAGASADLGKHVRVYGSVGSNDSIRIGPKNRIEGLVAAPTIDFGRRSKTGPLFCLLVVGGSQPCLPVSAPVVSPGSLGVGLVLPGTEDVEVPRRAHRAPLEAGSYRDLRLGRGSTLVLTGGDYLFDRVALASRAALRCAAPCRIAVRRTLRIGRRATVERLAGVVDTELRFDVSGLRSRTGVRLGARATVAGVLWAPTTTVRLGRRAEVTGSVQGAEVRIGSRARIGRRAEDPSG
ncbi:MAG TPA: hypothetical protein VNO26_06610 [Candidatus Limnocylindria bacterium]|nr:hypothetical protein [Candidatus Limnocylindria bacterium]